MPWSPAVADILTRAASLLALAFAPPLLSPEPLPSAHPLLAGILAALALTAIVLGAARLRARLSTRDARAGAALLILAVLASLAGAAVFRGDRAPLGRGVLFVAVPLWLGLALVAGAVAELRLWARLRHARLLAALIVAGAGLALFIASSRWLTSPDKMWWQVLRKDGSNASAVDALTRAASRARDRATLLHILDVCVTEQPDACACRARRADVQLRNHDPEAAVADARAAAERCPTDPTTRLTLAVALASHGEGDLAEQEARAGLQKSDDPRLHYALALALEHRSRPAEALTEARVAVDSGAGRDAVILLALLQINAGDLDTAVRALAPLVAADPSDAEAQYTLALAADKQDRLNSARQGYLAALRADPHFADARYNITLLTLRHGLLDEARIHGRQFREIFPGDPRTPELGRLVAAAVMKR